MKLRWTFLLIAAWFVAPTLAQEDSQEKPRSRRGSQAQKITREEARATSQQARIDRIRRKLNLGDEQKEEFDRIAAKYLEQRPGDVDRDRQRELMEEQSSARREKNWERVNEIQQELRQINIGRPISEFLNEIEKILNDDQLETLAEIRTRSASQRGSGRGPLAQLDRLRKELKLNDEQAEQYDELYAKLKEEMGQGGVDSEELSELIQEITKAAEEGDTERIQELRGQMPDPRGKSNKLIGDFLKKVERFIEPEQKETLDRFRREMKRGRSQIELRDCYRFVSRLGLDAEQRRTLREIQGDSRRAEREVRRDPEAREQLLKEVQQQLRDMLNDEQVAEFDRWIESKTSPRPGRGHRGDRPRRERPGKKPAGEETP